MSDVLKEALKLPESMRFQLAMLLLHSIENQIQTEDDLTEDQLKSLFQAKEQIESQKANLISRHELKASIKKAREERKKAS